ncbi:MAG TPA: carbonic anhydrase [Euzebyales bacterium]
MTEPNDTEATTSLVDGNRSYSETFDAGHTPKLPARGLFVLTCMDARVDPLRLLGLELGDAHIMRNAGGRVSDDAVRSLVVSSALQGTREVAVIHHTDCGLGATTDEQMRADLAARGVDVGNLWIGAFDDVDDSVRDDVATLRASLAGAEVTVTGYVYDVRTGALREVDGA